MVLHRTHLVRKKIHLAKRIPLAALLIHLVVLVQLVVDQKLKMILLVPPVAAILIRLVHQVVVTRPLILKNPVMGIVYILFDSVVIQSIAWLRRDFKLILWRRSVIGCRSRCGYLIGWEHHPTSISLKLVSNILSFLCPSDKHWPWA